MNLLVIVTNILLLATTLFLGLAEGGRTNNREWLDQQNKARRDLGLRPLIWDNKLAKYAQRYANQRKYDCAMVHSTGPYGENIYWGGGTWYTPRQAVSGWLSEKRMYNRATNSCRGPDCGHYTQIIWRDTRRVGCAKVVCNAGRGTLFVCEYDPPGNYSGERPY